MLKSNIRKNKELETQKNNWNLLNDVKSEIRNVQENLNKYSTNDKYLDISSVNSTIIQAGDSSILRHNNYTKSSKDLLLSGFNTNNNDDITEFKAKCLNDLSYLNKIKSVHNNLSNPAKLTHVDVFVPSSLTSSANKRIKSTASKYSLIDTYSSSNLDSNFNMFNGYNNFDNIGKMMQPKRHLASSSMSLHHHNNHLHYHSNQNVNSSSTLAVSQNEIKVIKKSTSKAIRDVSADARPTARKVAVVIHSPETNYYSKEKGNENNLHVSFKSPSLIKENDTYLTNRPDLIKHHHSNIITASSWRIGEALAQKQLNQHKTPPPLTSTIESNDQTQITSNITNNRTNRSTHNNLQTIQDQQKTQPKLPRSNLKQKKTEHFLIDDQIPVKLTNETKKKNNINNKSAKTSKQSKPYDLEDVHKYMLDKKTKRLFETKSEKEKQLKDEQERKRKLNELYQKQRAQQHQQQQQQPVTKTLSEPRIKPLLPPPSSISYEQDFRKELKDKINNLLEDNDKLVERKRIEKNTFESNKKRIKLVNFVDDNDDEEEEEEEGSESTYSNEITSPLQNLTNQSLLDQYDSRTSFEYKHDRLKKICSMALDLQTKLQQTKLKLFGVDQDDFTDNYADFNKFNQLKKSNFIDENDNNESMIHINKQKETNFKSNLPEIHIIDTDQMSQLSLPGVTNLKQFKPTRYELSPNSAASKIQTAFREFIHKKAEKTSVKTDFKTKKISKKSAKETVDLLKPKFDEYNFINVFKKKSISPQNKKSRQNSLVNKKTVKSSNLSSNRSRMKTVKESYDSTINDNDSSTSTSSSSSTSLSKYMNEPEDVLIKKDKISSSKSSSFNEDGDSDNGDDDEIKENIEIDHDEEEETKSSSGSNTTSDTLKNATSSSSSSPSPSSLTNSPKYSKLKSKTPSPTSTPIGAVAPPPPPIHKRILIKQTEPTELRYSPSSLEYLLNAGLNYLDTLNVSALHLEELDKMRCIGQAQQDTVALACLIKEKQSKAIADLQQKQSLKQNSSSSISSSSSMTSEASYSQSKSSYSNDFETNKTTSRAKTPNKDDKSSISTSMSNYSESEISDTKKKSNKKDESLINTVSDLVEKIPLKTVSSIQESIVDTEDDQDDESDEIEKSFKHVLPSKSHLNKTKRDQSINESIISNQSDRISFDDDSFRKFTDDIVKKYMQEEEMRSKHQAHLLKLREKALIDKTKAELNWLEQMKKKAQDKGEDEKMPSLLKKEKGIRKKLKQEQESIQQLKEVQRLATEKRMRILSKHHLQVFKLNENKLKSSINVNDSMDDESVNLSLNESKFKQHLNSEKYLTEREKKLRLRRQHAEEIIAWKKKLDDEEKKVREIEKKAKLALNTKSSTVQSTASTTTSNQNDITKNQSIATITRLNNDDINNKNRTESQIRKNDKQQNEYSESFISEANPVTTTVTTTKIKTETIASALVVTASKPEDVSIRTAILEDNIETQIDEDDDIHTKTIQDKITEEVDDDDNDDQTSKSAISSSSSSSKTSHLSSQTTTTTAKELENKVKQLKRELLKKKQEADKLRQSLKSKEKLKLKKQQEDLIKKITSYDNIIDKFKTELDKKPSPLPPSPSPTTTPPPPIVKRNESKQVKSKKNSYPPPSASASPSPLKISTKVDTKNQDDDDDQIKTLLEHTTTSIVTQIDPIKTNNSKSSSSASITLSSVSSSSSSSSSSKSTTSEKKKSLSKERASVIPAINHEDKYEDDFNQESTQNDSVSNIKRDDKFKEEDDDDKEDENNKSTVSEISEDLMIESSTSEKSSKLKNEQNKSESDTSTSTSASSSSTDTQILNLGRSKAESPTKINDSTNSTNDQKITQEKSSQIVDSLLNNVILNETIEQMITIRERKHRKLAEEKAREEARLEQDKLKIYIPSIDISPDDDDETSKSNSFKQLNKSQELKEKLIKLKVPYQRDKIEFLTDKAIDFYWFKLENNQSLNLEDNIEDNAQLNEYFKPILDDESKESELVFKRLLLDLIGELLRDMYLEKYDVTKSISKYFPCVKKGLKKQYFKSLIKGPNKIEETKDLVKSKLIGLFKLNDDFKQMNRRSKWRCQKRLDLVDCLLDNEMREQEFDWANYDVEEYEAKLMVSNTIFDMLLKDTIDCFEKNFLKKINNFSTQEI